MKPENLLLDKEFNLKIADFGFAGPLAGRDGQGLLNTELGTFNYMAPEILLHQPYKGAQIDIFASGIILFIMLAEHPPFTSATPKDPFYKCLAANRSDVFWATYEQDVPEGFFSEEFKELMTNLLKLNPSERPSIDDILASKWMQGPMPTKEEVRAEFEKRNETVKSQIKENKLQEK